MEWLRSHPYLDAFVVACSLFIVGGLVVRTQLAAPVSRSVSATWESTGGIYVHSVSTGDATLLPETYVGPSTRVENLGYIPLSTQNSVGTGPQDASENFDFGELLAALAQPAKQNSSPGADTTASSYSFIPSGLIATTTLEKPRTAQQDALYLYGNEVGDTIISFESTHPDQPSILKNHMEQPENLEAKAALKKLGNDLARVGDTISSLEAPTQAIGAHKALVAAYRDIGTKLATISDTEGNDALFDAIVTYNSAAEEFAKKFVSLAQVFQSYSVTFSPGDGGSVFMFPSSGL